MNRSVEQTNRPRTAFRFMWFVCPVLRFLPDELGKKDTHSLISVWNIIHSEKLWPGHGFSVYVHCDLDLGDTTLGQDHDTPLGHWQQVCEKWSRSNLAVMSYGPDMDLGYMCNVTLTLEKSPWVKVMTYPSVMDNKCVKYYPDPTLQWEVLTQTRILWNICALWPCPWRYDTPLGH